jgi:RimJ/RimL family protein N-acetyltransferase
VRTIETKRLVLRTPTPADAGELAGIYGDAEVMRFIGAGTPLSPDQTARAVDTMVRRWQLDGFGLFSVRRDDGCLLGEIGLLAWNPADWSTGSRREIGDSAEIEIGWTLGREHWGRGYATEAATAVRDWALGELGLERLISLIQPGNAASIRVAEKLGERYERDIVTIGGQTAHVYAVTGR